MTMFDTRPASGIPEQSARLMRLATYASTSVAVTLIDVDKEVPADVIERIHDIDGVLFLILEAMSRLLHPQPVDALAVGVGVMGLSIVATVALMLFQQHVIRQTGSTAIKADYLHYKTDLLVNGAVVAALVLSVYGWHGVDPLFAFLIAGYILYSAWEIVRESLGHLMDRELPQADRAKIKTIVGNHPQTRGMHDLRTRKAGTTSFIQLHLELDAKLNLLEAHAISDEVEAAIRKVFSDCEVIIHEDPAGLMEPKPAYAEDGGH